MGDRNVALIPFRDGSFRINFHIPEGHHLLPTREHTKTTQIGNSSAQSEVTTNRLFKGQKFTKEEVQAILDEYGPDMTGWKGATDDEPRPNQVTEVKYASYYRISHRVVPTLYDADKRVILIGDAAHTHSPVGGQGANTSMMDAWTVAGPVSVPPIRSIYCGSLLTSLYLFSTCQLVRHLLLSNPVEGDRQIASIDLMQWSNKRIVPIREMVLYLSNLHHRGFTSPFWQTCLGRYLLRWIVGPWISKATSWNMTGLSQEVGWTPRVKRL